MRTMKTTAGAVGSAMAFAALNAAGAAAQTAPIPLIPVTTEAKAAPAAEVLTTAASSGQVAEVIVTAQRRSESIQKAALTVQVLRADALANAGVTAPAQLTSALPTVQIATAGPATAVYVRGVGGFAANSLTSPAVPYYFDGVYVGRTQSVVSEFYDIERLELVKGPQGTLYGRNASGGAINVITRQPELGRYEARGSVEAGNYSDYSGEAAVNIPFGDKAALLVSGTVVDKGGYTSVGLGDDVHQSGRLKFLWKPTDDASLLLNASYGHVGGEGGAFVTLNKTIPGWYPWLDASDPKSQAFVSQTAAVPVPGFVRPTQPSDARQNLDFYNLSAQFDYTFGSTTLTVIPAFRHAQMQYSILLGFLYDDGYGLGNQPEQPETSSATSLEVRLSGQTSIFKWVGGLFYYNEDQAQQLTINNGFLSSNGWDLDPSTRSYAVFGQGTAALTQHFRLIGGLRATRDRRGLDGRFFLVSPAAFQGMPPPSAAACAFPAPTEAECQVDSFRGLKTYDNLSWKGGFEADVLDNSLLYATISRGFKAGGFSQQSQFGTPGQAQPFSPETLTSYEAGLKSRFLDNRLTLNVSGYYWDYKNHQEPVIAFTNAGVVNQIYLNAGSSEIYGGNLDVTGRFWAGGQVFTSIEWAHSRYNSFAFSEPSFAINASTNGCKQTPGDNGLTTVDCSGFQVSRTPEFSGDAGVNQTFDVGGGEIVANATVDFATARWLGTDFIAAERAAAYAKLDLSLTYRPPGKQWTLTGFVRNVNNASAYTEASKNPFSSLIYANIQPPRTYGARFAVNF